MPICAVPSSIRLKDSGGPPDFTLSLIASFERKDGTTRASEAQGPRGVNEYKSGDAGQWAGAEIKLELRRKVGVRLAVFDLRPDCDLCACPDHDTKESVPSDHKADAGDKGCALM